MIDVLPWFVVPLAGFGLVYMLKRRNRRLVRFYAIVAILSGLAALLMGPRCMCKEPMDQLQGGMIFAMLFNLVIFLVAAIVFKSLIARD